MTLIDAYGHYSISCSNEQDFKKFVDEIFKDHSDMMDNVMEKDSAHLARKEAGWKLKISESTGVIKYLDAKLDEWR